MAAGGFNGTTFGDQIERVYRNVMSNQREFTANLSQDYTTQAPHYVDVTSASGNGTVVTYLASNDFKVGETVQVSGLPVTSGSDLNLVGTISSCDSTYFVIHNTTVGTSAGDGVASVPRLNTKLYMTGVQAQSIQVGSILAIDEEVFLVNAVSVSSDATPVYTVTVTPAYEGSTNANHAAGTTVYINPKYTRWAIGVALNDALAAMSAPGMGLMREGYTTITYNPVLRGYDLAAAGVPEDFHSILSLSYDLPDPTHYFPVMRSFRVGRGILNSKIPGGYALFLNSSAMPGLPMQIAYGAPFYSATSTDQDMHTDLGLPLTCLDIPAIRAEIDLTLVREIKRNFTDSQPDMRKATDVVAGNVMNSVSGLEALYQKRMDEEANRFRNRWPQLKPIGI